MGPTRGSDGELDAFRRVYPAARQFAAFVAPASVEPDDLVQEALARVLASTSLVGLAEPLAYLRTTMVNIVRNEHRRVGREQVAYGRVDRREVRDDESDRIVLADEILAALQVLSPLSRALIFLVDVEDRPVGVAASALGMSQPTARTRLMRARRSLRRHLDLSAEVAT